MLKRTDCEVKFSQPDGEKFNLYDFLGIKFIIDIKNVIISDTFAINNVLLNQKLCHGRFPRPDELLDVNFQIETNRSYNLVDDYDKELIKDPFFKIINCFSKNCFMHLDYQFNSEKAIWESKMVRIKKR